MPCLLTYVPWLYARGREADARGTACSVFRAQLRTASLLLSQNLILRAAAFINDDNHILITLDPISTAHVYGNPHPHDQTHTLFTPHETETRTSRPPTLYHAELSTVQPHSDRPTSKHWQRHTFAVRPCITTTDRNSAPASEKPFHQARIP